MGRTETTVTRFPDEPLDLERPEHAFLVVHVGPGDGPASRVIDIPDDGEVSIGRAREATVTVVDEQVSRQHARVTRMGSDLRVEDMGSANGTFVNGVRIQGSRRLASGDEISVGGVTALVGITTPLSRSARVGSVASLEERLEAEADRALRFQRPFALIMFRLDGAAEVVRAALGGIRHSLRRMDLLAEYASDEFAVLLPETDAEGASEAARALGREARVGAAARGTVTIHVGAALCPRDGARPGRLLGRARAALREARSGLGREGIYSEPAGSTDGGLPGSDSLIAQDPQMQRLLSQVDKVAPSGLTVLLLGETGCGKEMIAHEIHRRSERRDRPFVRLNCAALAETLLESELFGHEKGAFTGADTRKTGYFEVAASGTILLDEIGEMPATLQAKLLRVLEHKTIMRVGGTTEIPVDVRIVCATHRDLHVEVRAGRFREDLFYRISAFTLCIPSLRDRPGEIAHLAEYFAARLSAGSGMAPATISAEALEALEEHEWPGNVRELRNAIERAVVLAGGGSIRPEHLPGSVLEVARRSTPDREMVAGFVSNTAEGALSGIERAAIVAALEASGGNQTRAADQLGITRRALSYRMKKHRVELKT